MLVYAVFKQGVYRHECAGVFSDESKARDVAQACLDRGDGYHTFEVVPFEVDAPPVFDADVDYHGGDVVIEPAAIWVAQKEHEWAR